MAAPETGLGTAYAQCGRGAAEFSHATEPSRPGLPLLIHQGCRFGSLRAASSAPALSSLLPRPLAWLPAALLSRGPLRGLRAVAAAAFARLLLGSAQRMRCRIRTVSGLLREPGLVRRGIDPSSARGGREAGAGAPGAAAGGVVVDLLKIDVERAEAGVLRGIDPADWPAIKQARAMHEHSNER